MADTASVLASLGKLDTTIQVLPRNQPVFRVHAARHSPNAFNPTRNADSRFSPLLDTSDSSAGAKTPDKVIPTLYAGSTVDCALMETVFHDIPFAAGIKMLSKTDFLAGRSHSCLRATRDLHLIDLRTVALHKLGISRTDLIDTHQSMYPATRQLAQSLHLQNPNAQGLLWTSRQDDAGTAMILFGDRLPGTALELVEGPTPLLASDGSATTEVLNLAIRLGVLLY